MARVGSVMREYSGDYKPSSRIETSPLFAWPFRPLDVLKWMFGYPGYVLPWASLYALLSLLTWAYLTPDIATMKTLDPRWIGCIFGRNLGLLSLIAGAWHLQLYVRRGQGTQFKYNG